jgi:hypothetical protein
MLVHLFDARQEKSVRRNGLLGFEAQVSHAKSIVSIESAVFAMPVLPNFFASHQWLRELKRRGMRSIMAAHFRIRADALVWFGRYNAEHALVSVGEATGIIMRDADPRGFEVIVPRSIEPPSIHAIRVVPQVVGWRYFPKSHEAPGPLCLCAACNRTGDPKAAKFRARLLAKYDAEYLNYEGPLPRTKRARKLNQP